MCRRQATRQTGAGMRLMTRTETMLHALDRVRAWWYRTTISDHQDHYTKLYIVAVNAPVWHRVCGALPEGLV